MARKLAYLLSQFLPLIRCVDLKVFVLLQLFLCALSVICGERVLIWLTAECCVLTAYS